MCAAPEVACDIALTYVGLCTFHSPRLFASADPAVRAVEYDRIQHWSEEGTPFQVGSLHTACIANFHRSGPCTCAYRP